MRDCEWIVCERSGRWAAALRRAVGPVASDRRQLHEARSLGELTARLDELPRAVALVEVRRTNLAETLTWLADVSSLHPQARCVALLDCETFEHEVRNGVAEVVLAAGAVDVTDSPRHLRQVLAVGRRHATAPVETPPGLDDRQSLAEWAWALLPWQSARPPIG